tara:strand:- start:10189 stop:10842 length:654 start_codon:yes stop_codon:yes gene_type:complete
MKTIQDEEGNVYVLKSDMESIIKERISKVSARAKEAETTARTLQTELEEAKKSAGISDTLSQQLDDYREQLQKANSRYDRYKAISKHGLIDDEMVEAIEWSYEKAMGKVGKKEQIPLTDWLEQAVADPTKAPAVLRPHLQNLNAEPQAVQQVQESTEAILEPQAEQQRYMPPAVNNGAKPAQQTPDLLRRAVSMSVDEYAQNREEIHKQWRARHTRG